jgi:hypothetical protein
MAQAGRERHPDSPLFLACSIEAQTDLGYAAIEQGDPDAGVRAYEQAERELNAWQGVEIPTLTLVRSTLANTWGVYLWPHDPEAAAPRFIESARLSRTLLASSEPRIRDFVLSHGYNGTAALWSQGRRDEAAELSRAYFEASKPVCLQDDARARRGCLSALGSYLTFLSWADDPEAPAMLERAQALQADVLERDADSASLRFDAMLFAFENGDFQTASLHSKWLRAHDSESWAVEMGPLAAALAGDLAGVDGWSESSAGGAQLGRALRDVSRGDFGAASRALRAIDQKLLWYQISWTPHPKPALVVPPAARAAFERFMRDFTRSYGAADMKALGASVDAFAAELDALKSTP